MLSDIEGRLSSLYMAYHAAICSPKGVVPDDEFYDPVIAQRMATDRFINDPISLKPKLPNPDGPEATDALEAMQERVRELEVALNEIAECRTSLNNNSDYSRGWNDARFRMREIARQASEKQP